MDNRLRQNDIVWHNAVATFCGFPVEEQAISVAGMNLRIAAMADATQLLDQPDHARRFLEADVAPYGVEVWPAGIMLAEHIARMEFKPQRVLEIGCGLGLVAIVAARLGWSITAGDHEPSALAFARHNARTNGAESVKFIHFDWNQLPDTPPFDCILGADILYQLNNHEPILCCLSRLLAPHGLALLSDPNRGVADRFRDKADTAGFHVETESATAEVPRGRPVGGRIFRLSRPLPKKGTP